MIADENFELPDAVRDIAAIYLDLIDLLTQKIDGLTFQLREATEVNDEMRRLILMCATWW